VVRLDDQLTVPGRVARIEVRNQLVENARDRLAVAGLPGLTLLDVAESCRRAAGKPGALAELDARQLMLRADLLDQRAGQVSGVEQLFS
jgi:hypothetical protein